MHIVALLIVICLTVTAPHTFGAVLTVTNFADNGPGTFRAQIAAAASGDIIRFSTSGKITLNSEVTISKRLRVEGQTGLHVSANNNSRIFNITSGAVEMFTMLVSDGRVVGTNGPAGFNGQNVYGGAIFVSSSASLYMQYVVVSNSVAIGGQGGPEGQFGEAGNGGNAFGGGIGSLGSLNLAFCTLVGNSTSGGLGGVAAPTNSPGVGGQGWGGGVYVQGTNFINSTTIHRNNAIAGTGDGGLGGGSGGGIYNAGILHLSSSTVVSNAALGSNLDFGGGIDNSGVLTVRDCTIAGNQSDFGGGISGGGGTYANTIIALNSAGFGPDGSGSINSSDYNLIQNTNALFIDGATANNILGQNPMLGPLSDNGGPTLTMTPLPGSPVIDKGRNSDTYDQRFRPRPFDGSIPNAPGGNGADIGALEVQPGTITVLNTNNAGLGSFRQAILDNAGLGGSNTIRFAPNLTGTIKLTSGELFVSSQAFIIGPGPERLALSGNTNGRVISVFRGPTHISGLTLQDGLVFGSEGNRGQDGYDGEGGGVYNNSILTLSNCVLRNNTVVGGLGGERHLGTVGRGGRGLGGGIYNAAGILSLIRCTFEGNRSFGGQGGPSISGSPGSGGTGFGGAVCSIGGTNQIAACNLVDNLAIGGQGGIASGDGSLGVGGPGYGGGLYNESTAIATASTISGGIAAGGTGLSAGSGYGGGIYNLRDLALASCTIASNSAIGSSFDFGGGIYNVGTLGVTNGTIAGNHADFGGGLHGSATFANTILAGNTATTSSPDGAGTINSYDYNLIQTFSGVTIVGATAHVIIGQDPLLAPLANNGGPTRTMALRIGSPAIDKGTNFGFVTDQRGAPRPFDFPFVANVAGGDGSDIGAFELALPQLSITRVSFNVVVRWPAAFGDFVLESVTNVAPTVNWTDVTNAPVVTPTEQFQITHNASGGNRFYRLRMR